MDKILTNYKWLFFLGSWSLVPKACYDKLVSFLMDNIGTPLDKDDLQWEDVNLDSHSRDSIDDTIYKDTVTGKEPDTNPYEEPLSDSEDLEAHEEEITNKLEAGLQNLKQNATINSSLSSTPDNWATHCSGQTKKLSTHWKEDDGFLVPHPEPP